MELREKLAKKITNMLSDEHSTEEKEGKDQDGKSIQDEGGEASDKGGGEQEEEQEEEKSEILDTVHESQIDKEKQLDIMEQELLKHTEIANKGSLVKQFLDTTSHQLTYTGLTELHSHVQEGNLCVFFRNNHFATLTKHEGTLYLLVTDLGYAGVQEVMWEKLDDISGDTDLYDGHFRKSQVQNIHPASAGPNLSPEQLLAQRGQSEADYQLALELSRNDQANPTNTLAEREGDLIAAATELSLQEYNNNSQGTTEESKANEESLQAMQIRMGEERDRELAMRLQAELNAAENRATQQRTSAPTNADASRLHSVEEMRRRERRRDSASSGCFIC